MKSNGILSEKIRINTGVGEEDSLSPLLFNLVINEIIKKS
jgi:hypothetical protein